MTVAEDSPSLRKPWTEVVAAKRAIREEHIKKPRDLSKTRRPVTNFTELADIETLTKLYQSGQASVQEVITAYIDKACDAHNKTNCLTEICFEDAMKQAKSLDASMMEYGALVGPLHGVPVSLKDQFDVEGFDSSLGYVGRAFAPATSDALLVSVLRQLGAVIIAKTNLPQSIKWCECENPLWGLTTHPLNPKFTSGGSSGGEGALLALNGSLIGWGTDIGGSIRIPSHMNGLWGLKPSSGRMSYQGVAVSTEGQQHVPSAVGPMARSLSSLSLVTKAVIGSESWKSDPQLPPLPWKENEFQTFSHRPLVIGVLLDDGVVKVHPPVERVLKETVAKLIDAGHEIVEWDASLHADCISIMDEYYTADGGEDIRQAVTEGGEPFLPHVQSLIDRAPPISVYEYWQLNKRKIAAQQAYHTMWNEKRSPTGRCVDVVLMPTMPHTAITHRSCRWVGYTKVFNILDYTALSFPAGKASKHDIALQAYEPRNPSDAWNWQRYDAEAMDGQHVGLQLVGRRFDEEKILGAATQVEQVLREA